MVRGKRLGPCDASRDGRAAAEHPSCDSGGKSCDSGAKEKNTSLCPILVGVGRVAGRAAAGVRALERVCAAAGGSWGLVSLARSKRSGGRW